LGEIYPGVHESVRKWLEDVIAGNGRGGRKGGVKEMILRGGCLDEKVTECADSLDQGMARHRDGWRCAYIG